MSESKMANTVAALGDMLGSSGDATLTGTNRAATPLPINPDDDGVFTSASRPTRAPSDPAVNYDDDLAPDRTVIRFGDLEVYPKALDDSALDALTAIMRSVHVLIHVTVGDGPGAATVYGCDLSREYIAINADYTT